MALSEHCLIPAALSDALRRALQELLIGTACCREREFEEQLRDDEPDWMRFLGVCEDTCKKARDLGIELFRQGRVVQPRLLGTEQEFTDFKSELEEGQLWVVEEDVPETIYSRA